jgi:hypothetical protein
MHLADTPDRPVARQNAPKRELEVGGGDMDRVAECHCGQLRAIASGEPERVYVCHCKACQRRTGAVIHSGATYSKSQVRFEGEEKVYARGAASGFEIRFHFCANCGSNVYFEGDRFPDLCGIAVGSFADPKFPAPTYSAWEESMHDWLELPSLPEHFPQGRTEMSDDLTNHQIALLCEIGEHERLKVWREVDKQGDLQRLLSDGYVEPKEGHSGSALQLTAKALQFLGERGAGLNEA